MICPWILHGACALYDSDVDEERTAGSDVQASQHHNLMRVFVPASNGAGPFNYACVDGQARSLFLAYMVLHNNVLNPVETVPLVLFLS